MAQHISGITFIIFNFSKSPIMILIPNKTLSGDPRCPVKMFKEYIKIRPAATLTPESRTYLSSVHKITPDSSDPPVISVRFSKQPIGKNKLEDLAKTKSQKGGLSGKKVNHSARKTTVTSLLHSKSGSYSNYAINWKWSQKCSVH
jgi:hypothetical protein